ncbi:hypothetical protein [Micromonospora sp. NPDC047134]|uniref:hypothetical protein n=1 Tax=Micromonospora sp. NPDC047134 TaxID=3154340 RepID=UPI0033C8DF76
MRRWRASHWWTLSLLLTVLLVPLAGGTPVTAAPPDETGKYYVVGPPVNGQRDYLYSIALRTLGNGNRFREIIELNRGREQPDGATFTDGVELAPGWVLVLPKDADGPGVRTGRLPAIRPPTPSTPPSPATPSPLSPSPPAPPSPTPAPPSPSGSPSSPARSAPAEDPPAPADTGPPAQAAPSRLAGVTPDLVRVGAGALALGLAVVALLVLPRRVYRMRGVTLDDGPWPPQRHHTPTPAELAASAAPPDLTVPQKQNPAASADPKPPGARTTETSPTSTQDPEPPPVVPAAPPAAAPGPPSWPMMPAAPSRPAVSVAVPEGPAAAVPAAGTGPGATAARSGSGQEDGGPPRPELPADGEVPYVRTELSTDHGPILVRLVGVTTGPATAAYAWLAEHEPAPAAAVPLVLGRAGPWRLQIDLGRAPDVFTLVGAVQECRRLAAAYALQLLAAGVVVAVVGDALDADLVEGCRRLAAWPQTPELGPGPYVVITTDAAAGVRGLSAGSAGRGIPLVIGPVPYGRWSAQLGGGDPS